MSRGSAERRKDMEEAREARKQRDEARKVAAARVLNNGGTMQEAARAAGVDERTLKKWLAGRTSS